MEQLGKHEGHLTRFGTILRTPDRRYIKRVKMIFIDKAQTVYTAGIAKHGQAAFRPAYGHFDGICLLFPKSTSVLAFSATMPPHMLPVIKKKLMLSLA
jgi:superfamily II DNA helicase RecQ